MEKTKWLLTTILAAILFMALPVYGAEASQNTQENGFLYTDDGNGTATITGYNGPGGHVQIPSTLGGKTVWNIDEGAFKNHTGLTSIEIPNGITQISYEAFYGCANLASITLPDTVTDIGGSAFEECQKLKTITLPKKLTSIRTFTFQNCDSLTDIEISDNVTSIGEYAFCGCDNLASVAISASVTEISQDAFQNCDHLNTIRINADNKIFDSRENCNAVIRKADHTLLVGCAGTTIPDGIISIGNKAFQYCTGLTAIAIPASVKDIGEKAFNQCNHLANLTLAEGVVSIGTTAFGDCGDLTDVVIPASVQEVGQNAFFSCTSLTNVTITDGVASIGKGAFLGCEELKSVTIPASVKSIGEKAFGYTDSESDPDPNFVIRSAAGSAAESYARSNGMVAQPAPADKTDISAATVTLEKDSYVYSKTACTPAVTVKLGEKTLVRDTDYSVSYSNNIRPGTAKVTVTGKGQYTGSKTVSFTITESSEIPNPGQQQPGQQQPGQQQPAVSITCPKTVYKVAYGVKPFRITASADGGLTWKSSDKKVATVDAKGKVTVKGTGIAFITIQSGSASVKVTIRVNPQKPVVSSAKVAKGRKLAVKWKKDKRAAGYQVQLSFTKTFKKIEKKLTTKKNTCIFKKLKTGKTCYVRIRSYKKSGSEKLYSAWSKPKKGGKIKK